MSFQNEKWGERKVKKRKDNYDYSAETIKNRRKFPARNTAIIAICVVAQMVLIFLAVTAKAEPQDIIEKYNVTVEPLEDGTLDIEYSFLWKAIDTTEELTWVEIGMPNAMFTVYEDSVSGNIKEYSGIYDEGYTAVRLDFKRGYKGGENIQFSFKVNQEYMLCENDFGGHLYEFVPGWFNSTPVEKYEFKWKHSINCVNAEGGKLKNGYYVWTGSFDCGEYDIMRVSYDLNAFRNAMTVEYEPFYTDGAYNQLEGSQTGNRTLYCMGIIILLFVEIYLLDSHVSYRRGRGFLVGYGHPIHTYGYQNPRYIRAYNRAHTSTSTGRSGGGLRGGGCACACACACAGGGRAGCSQKDTYTNIERIKKY